MIRTLQTFICLLFILLLAGGCDEDKLQVDVSNIGADVHIERLDRQWFDLTPVSFRKEHPRYVETYGELYQRYVEDVLGLGKVNDSNLFAEIQRFTADPAISEVQQRVQQTYADLGPLEAELKDAWKHYRYYFPQRPVPAHISLITGFNVPFIMTGQGVGIGLEMFLGKDCEYYEYLQLPLYLRQRMTPAHLAPWLMKGWLETEFVMEKAQPSLLDEIVHQGKIMYCLDAVMPAHNDSLKIGYTGTELKWADEHEHFVWAHFVDNELLFSTDREMIAKYTSEGPFTVDLVKESPSRMGYYIGWQLVRDYMERQEGTDLNALMRADAQMILKKSNYKP